MNIFSGRINRRQYFIGYFVFLPIILIIGVLIFMLSVLPLANWLKFEQSNFQIYASIGLYIPLFFYLLILNIKRLHDLGHKGTYYVIFIIFNQLIYFVLEKNPLILVGIIIAFYLFLAKGNEEENEFGTNPKKKSAYEAVFNTTKEDEKAKLNSKIKNFFFKFLIIYLTTTILILVTHFTLIPYLRSVEREDFKKIVIKACEENNKSTNECNCEYEYVENKIGYEKYKENLELIGLLTMSYDINTKYKQIEKDLFENDDFLLLSAEASINCKNK